MVYGGVNMKDKIYNMLRHKPVLFLDQILYRIGEDSIFAIGGQLSYFLILSIFPFLIVTLNIISYTRLADVNVVSEVLRYIPLSMQSVITGFIDDVVESSSQGFLSIAAIATIWTASSGVTPVIRAINRAYDYDEKRSFIRLKLLSILFTIALIFLLIISLVALVFGELIGTRLFGYLGIGDLFLTFWSHMRYIIPIAAMVFIFALLYKFSPCVGIRSTITIRSALPGAIFAAIGWIITSMGFSFYVSNFGKYSRVYGSLGGIIAIMVWLYLSSIIILLGGEINATLSYFNGNRYELNADKSVLKKLIDKL